MSGPKSLFCFWNDKTPEDFRQEAHDRGEQDASEGRYDNPYNRVGDAVVGGPYDPDRKEAYDEGHDNTTSQLEGDETPSDD